MKNKLFFRTLFKTFSFSLLLSFFIIFLVFLFQFFLNKNTPAVIFFDIGQGDATLLRNINGKNILIDGGPDNKILKKIGKSLPYFNRKIDLLVLSHHHEDHVSGLLELVHRYPIDNLFLAEGLNTSYLQNLLVNYVQAGGLDGNSEIFWIGDFLKLDLGDNCYLSFMNPKVFSKTDNDNDSLITKLDCENKIFLFSGDNEFKVEEALIKEGVNLQADVLKASHHGSKTSNTLNFLQTVSPDFFVISVGLDNKHKLPSLEVVSRVKDLGIAIMRTDFDKDIVFSLDIKEN